MKKKMQTHVHPEDGQKGESGEVQTRQLNCTPLEGYGLNSPISHFQAKEG